MTMRITTIIPTYQRPKLLRRAVESALNQTYADLMICIYDNASGDETESVVSEYVQQDERVRYIKNPTNVGAIANMIGGVQNVQTEFYSLLNDDDFLMPDFYENAMEEFSKCPAATFVCARTMTVDLINRRMQLRNKDWLSGQYIPSIETTSHMFDSHFALPGVLFRQDMREIAGVFEPSGDDRLYLVMAAAASPFVVTDRCGAVYSVHPQAYSIATGLRNTEVHLVYEALLSVVRQILNMEMPTERKVNLLFLALGAYGQSLDSRILRAYVGHDKIADGHLKSEFPSRVTRNGLLRKIFEKCPQILRPGVSSGLDLARWVGHMAMKQKNAGLWEPLSVETFHILSDGGADISNFVSAINEVSVNKIPNK